MKPKIAIIGAGLTGLTTAFYLKKMGFAITIFEKAGRTGGVIKTLRENGFTYECGPNTGTLGHAEAAELFEELYPDCEVEIADEAAKARWIWKNGKWEPLPSGLISAIRTPLFTMRDKFRICAEPYRKKGDNPNETLAEMTVRRLGKSFLTYAVDPFILGIYAGDPHQLVTKYALPKLYNLEYNYGSFMKGAHAKHKIPKTERDRKATREIFSIKNGLQNLIDVLEKRVGAENILLNCNDLQINSEGESFSIKTNGKIFSGFSHAIVTTGAFALENMLPFAGKTEIGKIARLKYAKIVQVSMGFKNWNSIPLKSFGGLVPSVEKRDVLGVLFISSFLKNRAPENGVLLSSFIGGIRNEKLTQLSDDEIYALVEREIKAMMKLEIFAPDLFKINRYSHAIPQYGIESEEKLAAIERLQERFPGLIIAGNTRDGIGMADRIRQGRNIAEKIANDYPEYGKIE